MSTGLYTHLASGGFPIKNSYYKFDETTGDAIDSGSNGFDGSLNGTITRDGVFYEFIDGLNYVETPVNSAYNFRKGSGLVDFVLKANVVFYSTKRGWIISKRPSTGFAAQDWQLRYDAGELAFDFYGDGTNRLPHSFTPVINQEYIVGVRCVDNIYSIFIDGSVVATLDVSSVSYDDTQGVSSPIEIGASTLTYNTNVDGKIREVFIQKGEGWTDQEILDNYNNNGIVTL